MCSPFPSTSLQIHPSPELQPHLHVCCPADTPSSKADLTVLPPNPVSSPPPVTSGSRTHTPATVFLRQTPGSSFRACPTGFASSVINAAPALHSLSRGAGMTAALAHQESCTGHRSHGGVQRCILPRAGLGEDTVGGDRRGDRADCDGAQGGGREAR